MKVSDVSEVSVYSESDMQWLVTKEGDRGGEFVVDANKIENEKREGGASKEQENYPKEEEEQEEDHGEGVEEEGSSVGTAPFTDEEADAVGNDAPRHPDHHGTAQPIRRTGEMPQKKTQYRGYLDS